MFADDGIEFFQFHLVRLGTLVLGGRVIVAGAGRRDELDFVAS